MSTHLGHLPTETLFIHNLQQKIEDLVSLERQAQADLQQSLLEKTQQLFKAVQESAEYSKTTKLLNGQVEDYKTKLLEKEVEVQQLKDRIYELQREKEALRRELDKMTRRQEDTEETLQRQIARVDRLEFELTHTRTTTVHHQNSDPCVQIGNALQHLGRNIVRFLRC